MKRAVPLLVLVACGGAAPEANPSRSAETTGADERATATEEEEPDDGLEVTGTRGKMDRGAIQSAMAPHESTLHDCFLSRVAKQKWLGGHVDLKWEIAKDGTLKSAQVATSDLGAWPVEKCMLDIARKITFAAPKGGDADFTVPFDFEGQKSVVVWDPSEVNAVLAKRVRDLAACAKKAKTADPGAVQVTLYLGPRGKVQSAGFSSAAPIPDAWAACAHGKVTSWTLRDPKGQIAKLAFVYRAGEAL